jgi:hypothetical protein
MAELFLMLMFIWSMVALFVVAQVIIMMFTSSNDLPSVFHWRRK